MAHIERRVRCRTCGGPFVSGSCQKCGRQASQVAYRARYIDPTGRERSRSFSRKVDAERFLTTVESAKLQGTWTDPARGKVTFAAWLETWWTTATDLRPSTRARDRSYFNSLILPRFGATPLAAITQPAVQAWVADLLTRGLAAETVVKAYQLLRRTMTAAVNADMLARSPCRAVRLPKIERPGDALPDPGRGRPPGRRHRPALPGAGAAGGLWRPAHRGACRPTPWSREPRARHRRCRRDRRRGQGQALRRAAQDAGRPADDRPTQAVVEELAIHMGPLSAADAHVFTSDKGGTLRTSNFRAKVWLPAVRAAGLAPLRPHDLRHTAVALWIAAGANPKEVSVRAGHTSVAFTLDRYGHLFEGHDLEVRDRLDTMLAEGLKEAAAKGSVTPLRSVTSSQGDGPGTAQGNPSNEEDPAPHRVLPAGLVGAPPGTRTPNRCLRAPIDRFRDLRRSVGKSRLPDHFVAGTVRC
jgi:integrase